MMSPQVGPVYGDVCQRRDSRGSHLLEGCLAKPGRMEGAQQEPCNPEVQGAATPGYFLERHRTITMRKGKGFGLWVHNDGFNFLV